MMALNEQQLKKLTHDAIAAFKMAAYHGTSEPVGMAIMLRSQIIFTGFNAPSDTGRDITEQCLFHPHELLAPSTAREDIPACMEITAICISQTFNPDKPIEPQVDENIKRKLADSPLIGDGQIVHVVHPYQDAAMHFKL